MFLINLYPFRGAEFMSVNIILNISLGSFVSKFERMMHDTCLWGEYYHFYLSALFKTLQSRLLDHVISCDWNLKDSCGRGYRKARKFVFYYSQNSLLHLCIPPFWILAFPVLFVLHTGAKIIESTARCNIGMQERPSFKTNKMLVILAISIVQTNKLYEKMQKN